ncbi:MAG: apolipoprotein N-acyltransferase [Ignavibacteriales bacterium]|nr:apolipoprotein N-acyltransferase [Ignavibacteriales bacterium]
MSSILTSSNHHSESLRNYFLMALSGFLFGISFPPNPVGTFAFVAFVPLLLVLLSSESLSRSLRYFYVMMFVTSCVSLYWISGIVHLRDNYLLLAGILVLLSHPVFYFLPIIGFVFIRKSLGERIALFAFPFLWITNEYFRAHTDFAFPWLTVGNTQTYDLSLIQLASITGVYGISFLVLSFNVIATYLFIQVAQKKWNTLSLQTGISVLLLLSLYAIPKITGKQILNEHPKNNIPAHPLRVAIVQPHIDPWNKWDNSIDFQLTILQEMSREIIPFRPDIIVWPETAIPVYILEPSNEVYKKQIVDFVDSNHFSLFTGIPDVKYYDNESSAPSSSRIIKDSDIRYDAFNSSMLLTPHSEKIQKYAKMALVPFAERVPYADVLHFLDFLEWGVGIGGWGKGKDTTVFQFQTQRGTTVRFGNMICYESIFPQIASVFTNKDADFFTVITNDSWWGNTSGVYQHLRYSVFRAVENRKWIVRSANGGVSCFIDPYGRMHNATDFNTRQVLFKEIELMKEKTFYSSHPDWFAIWCVIISALFLATAITKKYFPIT